MRVLHISNVYVNALTRPQSAIKHQMAAIKTHMVNGAVRRAADSTKDAGEIDASYRALSYLFDAFLVSSGCADPI